MALLTRTTTTPLPIREVGVVRMGFGTEQIPHLPHFTHHTFQGEETDEDHLHRLDCQRRQMADPSPWHPGAAGPSKSH